VSQDQERFKDSCDLAKISLAVWLAKREAFAEFDRWMFSFESGDFWRPRGLENAKAKAVELVGQAKFDAAQADAWIDRYIQASILIYGDSILSGNAVPKLVYGQRWALPEPNDADELVRILQDNLGVPKP
jgi:hypothetical protein